MPGIESRLPSAAIVKMRSNVSSAGVLQAKKEADTLVCAHIYAFVGEHVAPGQGGMRCALFLSEETI